MFVAPIPLLWLVRGSRPGRAALCGFAFGLAYFGALLYWILLFGELGWAALVIMSAGFTAAFGALAPAVWRREHALLGTFGLAGLWTVIEWVRGMIPLGGFGWGQLGVTQVDAPALPLASIGGVWALSFLVMVVAGLLLLAWERWGSGRRAAALVLAVAALVLAVVPAAIPIPAPDGRTLDVATIQVDVASVQDLVGADEDVAVARLNIDRHLQLADDPPDLVVWGEGALDPGVTSDPLMMTAVSQAIATVGAPTIAGAVTDDPDGTQRTVTLAFDATGKIVDRYVKVKLVPFGEYVPFRRELGWISATDQVPVDRTPGTEVSLISIPGLPPIGTPICYENSFPSIDREMTREGAGFLVVVINNASYDRTAASEQHLQMSRLRAVENGRWVVHAAVSGISAFIDERGDVVDSRGLFEPATMRAMVRASDRRTLFTRLGDWVPWGSMILVVGLIALPRSRRRQRREPGPLPAQPRTLVILPTYNERATIGAVLDGLTATGAELDILVVDDGSPDGTGEIVRERSEADPHIRLVERPRKSGLASAYAVGFEPGDRRGVRPGRRDGLGPVAPARGAPQAPGGRPAAPPRDREPLRPGWVGHELEPGSGRAVQGREPVRAVLSGLRPSTTPRAASGCTGGRRSRRSRATPITSDGYGFQIELVYRAWNLGLSVGEAPISFREREHGQSKISRRIVVEALWLVTLWGLRARFRPDPEP